MNLQSSLYVGIVNHKRSIPRNHEFSYPFFMWFLNLDEIENVRPLGKWFSTSHWALSRYCRSDYLGDPNISLSEAVKKRMEELTEYPVEGTVYGLMNMRTLGVYFSPVNFYYGYDANGELSHFLAEVSNIPWNERHQYCHYVANNNLQPDNPKMFHVSPFNPMDQHYKWTITNPDEKIKVQIMVDDKRGHLFTASLDLNQVPLTLQNVRRELLKKPVMTMYIVLRIYWQALKLYIKGVPYVDYKKETT